MGKKGAKLTGEAAAAAAAFAERIADIGEVSSKKMFGGFGIFESGVMFGIVDSGGAVFLRQGPRNSALFEEAGSKRHGKMPYYSIPEEVMASDAAVSEWAAKAAQAAHDAKNG